MAAIYRFDGDKQKGAHTSFIETLNSDDIKVTVSRGETVSLTDDQWNRLSRYFYMTPSDQPPPTPGGGSTGGGTTSGSANQVVGKNIPPLDASKNGFGWLYDHVAGAMVWVRQASKAELDAGLDALQS